MFKQLYLSELKKLFSLKTAMVLAAITLVLFLIMAFAFQAITMVNNMGGDDLWEGEEPMENISFSIHVDAENAETAIVALKLQLAEEEEWKKQHGYQYRTNADSIYEIKAMLAAYQYVQEKELYDRDIYIYFGAGNAFVLGMFDQTAQNFVTGMLAVLSSLAMIYGLIVGSGAYASEIKNGTLKLVFLRPITRNKLTTAKLLACLTLVTGLFLGITLITVLYGYIRYDAPVRDMLFVFNAQKAYLATSGAGVASSFFTSLLSVYAYTVAAFAIGTITKSRVLGIVLPLAADLAAFVAGYATVGRFWFSEVVSWDKFFALGAPSYGGTNFYIALSFFILYIGGLLAAAYLVFNKRDIA